MGSGIELMEERLIKRLMASIKCDFVDNTTKCIMSMFLVTVKACGF